MSREILHPGYRYRGKLHSRGGRVPESEGDVEPVGEGSRVIWTDTKTNVCCLWLRSIDFILSLNNLPATHRVS